MNTSITNDYMTVLSDRTFRLTAERLVHKCGVRADLKGAKCLTDAVILHGVYPSLGFCEIYRIIGELTTIQPKSVMREISYAISQAFGIRERLSKLIGIDIPAADIHNSLVIAYLGKLFQEPNMYIYA